MSDAKLERTLRQIIRTPQDVADYMIADFEAQTGMVATEQDRRDALRLVRDMAHSNTHNQRTNSAPETAQP